MRPTPYARWQPNAVQPAPGRHARSGRLTPNRITEKTIAKRPLADATSAVVSGTAATHAVQPALRS
ncbi:hypothetical protein [Kribbella sp. CA-294648]|uniref:hypothetical protein n=1 Tax=Kribbella sp. CA-294648 TaxID=3239948 RepID=UPI003D94C6AE